VGGELGLNLGDDGIAMVGRRDEYDVGRQTLQPHQEAVIELVAGRLRVVA